MAECLAPREVLHLLWTPLDALRGTDVDFVGFSLTSPNQEDVDEHAIVFARLAEQAGGEGALMVRDLGPLHGRPHYYALVLSRDIPGLRWQWCELTGADQKTITISPVTGWRESAAKRKSFVSYPKNVTGAVFYAFHALPGDAVRCLNTDVHASGPFAPVWDAAQRAIAAKLRGQGTLRPEDAAEASFKRRECPFCHQPFRSRKRPHAIWCSPRCRKAAYAAGLTVMHGQLVPKVHDATPNAGSDAVTDE